MSSLVVVPAARSDGAVGDLNLAGSQFRGSHTEMLLIAGAFATAVVVGVVLFLILNKRRETDRRAGILPVVQLLDGRPVVHISYAECPMSVPDLLGMAQARGYALTPNPAAGRYELVRGAPQTAFAGHPRAAYIAQVLDGRPESELPVYGEPMSLPELMVVAHSRGYTVQKNDRVRAVPGGVKPVAAPRAASRPPVWLATRAPAPPAPAPGSSA